VKSTRLKNGQDNKLTARSVVGVSKQINDK